MAKCGPAICPVCRGSGALPMPRPVVPRDIKAERRAMAKTLREAGYSLRQIGGFLNMSARGVSLACDKTHAAKWSGGVSGAGLVSSPSKAVLEMIRKTKNQ
jgi:hypothetical protein